MNQNTCKCAHWSRLYVTSLKKKKTNAMELIEQGIPRIEMSQTCTQKSKCGALTESLKRNGN